MEERPVGVIALAAVSLGLFATLLVPSNTDFKYSLVSGSSKGSPGLMAQPSLLTSWLFPLLGTAKMLHDDLQMPVDLALETAASIHRHTLATRIAPELVVALIQVESGGDPRAVSPKQAVGLMQVRHSVWAKTLGVSYRELFDIDTNIRAGIYILNYYLKRHGTMTAALAAYSGNPRSTRYPKKVLATYRELASET